MTSELSNQPLSPWFNTAKAAAYLGARPGTLKNWRHRGEGPRYSIINRRLIRYHRDELDKFAVAGRSHAQVEPRRTAGAP